MEITFSKLTSPTPEIASTMDKWENNPAIVPFIRPSQNELELAKPHPVTVESLQERLKHNHIYLIYADNDLVGEVNYQVDPPQLYKKEKGTAWVGINIGDETARGKGIGMKAILFLEEQARAQGLKRIELGVFEFNVPAIKLYTRMGYQEIGRINDFTFWQEKMWQDIRMEKRLI